MQPELELELKLGVLMFMVSGGRRTEVIRKRRGMQEL